MYNYLIGKAYKCINCSFDYIEEKYDDESGEYYIGCNSCGNESSRTFIMEEAIKIWNEENCDIKTILGIKVEIDYYKKEIEFLENTINDNEEEIDRLYTRLKELNKFI